MCIASRAGCSQSEIRASHADQSSVIQKNAATAGKHGCSKAVYITSSS